MTCDLDLTGSPVDLQPRHNPVFQTLDGVAALDVQEHPLPSHGGRPNDAHKEQCFGYGAEWLTTCLRYGCDMA